MASKYPTSSSYRKYFKQANIPFKASDSIAKYIIPDDLGFIVNEVERAFKDVLRTLLIDIDNDPNSQDTARRLAKMYVHEIMSGRYHGRPNIAAFPNEGEYKYEGMLVVRSEIKSVCAHHHQPVAGVCYIGIIPGEKVIGLSKYSRIAQWCARRGTLQEELTKQISKEIREITGSEDVGVHIEAIHGCCENRGIMAHSSLTQTTVLSGQFEFADVKAEFFDNILLQKK